jgi:hypothetical protein
VPSTGGRGGGGGGRSCGGKERRGRPKLWRLHARNSFHGCTGVAPLQAHADEPLGCFLQQMNGLFGFELEVGRGGGVA